MAQETTEIQETNDPPPDAQPNGAADTTPAPPPGPWYGEVSDDLRPTAERFSSPTDLLKSYGELRTRLDASVMIPGEKATPEEIAKFNKRIGVPENADGYGIAAPDNWDDAATERLNTFLASMHEEGARPGTVKRAVEFYQNMVQEAHDAWMANIKSVRETAEAELRKEWNTDEAFKANKAMAARGANHWGGEQLLQLELKDGSLLGDHPMMLRAFAKIGRAMGESDNILPDLGLSDEGRETLLAEADRLMDEVSKDRYNAAENEHKQRRISEIYKQVYGEEEIPSKQTVIAS